MWRSKNFRAVQFIVTSIIRRPRFIQLTILVGILMFVYYGMRPKYTDETRHFVQIEQHNRGRFGNRDDIKIAELKQNVDIAKNIQRNVERAKLLKIDDEIKKSPVVPQQQPLENKSFDKTKIVKKVMNNQLQNNDIDKPKLVINNNFDKSMDKSDKTAHTISNEIQNLDVFQKRKNEEPVNSNIVNKFNKKLREKREIFENSNDLNKKEEDIPENPQKMNNAVFQEGEDSEEMRNFGDAPKKRAIPKMQDEVNKQFEAVPQNIEKANDSVENADFLPEEDIPKRKNAQQFELKPQNSDSKRHRSQNDDSLKVPNNQQIHDQEDSQPEDSQHDDIKKKNAINSADNAKLNKNEKKRVKKEEPPKETQEEMEKRFFELSKKCYELKNTDENLVLLDDIMKSPPQPDNNIFFHDTSCSNNGQMIFNMRYFINDNMDITSLLHLSQ